MDGVVCAHRVNTVSLGHRRALAYSFYIIEHIDATPTQYYHQNTAKHAKIPTSIKFE